MQPLFSLVTADWPPAMSLEAHKRAIAALLLEVYEYFNEPVAMHIVKMRAEDLSRFSFAEVKYAVDTYRTAQPPPGHKKIAPQPHHLIAILEPQLSAEEQANMVASEILYWVNTAGNPNWHKVKNLSEAAHEVIRQEGGWQNLCATTLVANQTSKTAQWRDKALSILRRAEHNKHHQALAALRAAHTKSMPTAKVALPKDAMSSIGHVIETLCGQAPSESVHGRG